jgi:formylglycine-generating enzyme required for sulfatase activity
MTRKLRVFLCHASQDKPAVRELYKRLAAEAWIDPWLDEENLLPGQDFDLEIYKATRDADAILICLSKVSVAKEGYVNKEIRRAYDIAQEKPEGTIYVIPLRLDECDPSFEYLRKLHWVDYFMPNAHEKLVKALRVRAGVLKIEISELKFESAIEAKSDTSLDVDLDLYRFIQIYPTEKAPYSFYIGKYPVTNTQYERFLNAKDYSEASLWRGFLKFNEYCIQIGFWHDDGWSWLQKELKDPKKFLDNQRIKPEYWDDEDIGIANPDNPVVGITWFEANAYCNWLMKHWGKLIESRANFGLRMKQIRLPLDFEWTAAAGGENSSVHYAWGMAKKGTLDELVRHMNVADQVGHTTPVNAYLRGASLLGVMDMSGNVWEWQANYQDQNQERKKGFLGMHGGSWADHVEFARVTSRKSAPPNYRLPIVGFRVVLLPSG